MKRKEFFDKWVEALKSGKYKQTKEALFNKKKNSYCCLGVACVVANENGIKNIDFDNVENELLPNSLAKFLNISHGGQFFTFVTHNGKYYMSLVGLNDNGVRFPTIAKIIAEQMMAKNFVKYNE